MDLSLSWSADSHLRQQLPHVSTVMAEKIIDHIQLSADQRTKTDRYTYSCRGLNKAFQSCQRFLLLF